MSPGRSQLFQGAGWPVPKNSRSGSGIVGAAEPGRAAAGLPHVAGPGGVERAGHRDVLAGSVPMWPSIVGRVPDLLAGLGIVGLDRADDAELAARVADDDLALHDQRCGGVGVAVLVLVHLLAPDDLAGLVVSATSWASSVVK